MPPQRDIPIKRICEKCGSEIVLPDRPVEGDFSISIAGPRRIKAFDPIHAAAHILARICGDCGHVELIVENAAELMQAYRRIGN